MRFQISFEAKRFALVLNLHKIIKFYFLIFYNFEVYKAVKILGLNANSANSNGPKCPRFFHWDICVAAGENPSDVAGSVFKL